MILTNGLYLLSLVLQSQLTIYDLGPEYEGNNREVHVENDDIVVFNYPAEIEPEDSFQDPTLKSDVPIDLKNNYVKRCFC